MHTRIIIVSLIVNISLSVQAIAGAEPKDTCVFNPESISFEFLEEVEEFKSIKVDNETNEASVAISSNGKFLYVKQWSCTHFGMLTRYMIVSPEKEDFNSFLDEALWIAERTLDKKDYTFLKSEIDKKEISFDSNPKELRFIHDMYEDFVLVLDFRDDILVISILYYMS